MSDKLRKTGDSLKKDRKDTDFNTRRVNPNLPMIERKLDIVSPTHTYSLDFYLSTNPHSVRLNIRFKPDNCCDCEFGSYTQAKDAWGTPTNYGPYGPSIVPEEYSDGLLHLASYASPLVQTDSGLQGWWGYPWWHSLWELYGGSTVGGFGLSPEGYITIPINGIYTLISRGRINGSAYDDEAAVYASIQRISALSGNQDALATHKYSSSIGNLDLSNGDTYVSVCTPLNKDDKVAAAYQAIKIRDFVPLVGSNGDVNQLIVSLRGLGWGSIYGHVRDIYGNGIYGATVSYTVGFGGSTLTDVTGRYFFDQLPPAVYNFTASAAGFANSMTRSIEVVFNTTVVLDFLLT